MTVSGNQGFPQIGLPLVSQNGTITQTWLQLLISLWQRTGGGQGGGFAPTDGTYVVQQSNPDIPSALVATNTLTISWDFSTPLEAKLDVNEGNLVIAQSQVTGLIAALAGKVSSSVMVVAGSGLTGGGPLTTNVTLSVASNGVTNSMLAMMPADTIKGNNTAGTADPTDLTGAQVTALLSAFTSTNNGVVPASGGGTTNFLRADANFANPLAGGASGTVTLAALTGGGTQGSLTVTNGLITGIVNPT